MSAPEKKFAKNAKYPGLLRKGFYQKLFASLNKEVTFFKSSDYYFSFRPLLVAQGLALFLLFVVLGSFILPAKKPLSLSFVSPASVQPAAVVVAGQPVHWRAFIKQGDLSESKHLLGLPKNASNIKIKKVSDKDAKDILTKKPVQEISLKQRQELAVAPKALKSKGFLASIRNAFLADGEAAVENLLQVVSDDSSSQNSTVVDLTDLSQTTTPTDQTPVQTETPAETTDLEQTTTPTDQTPVHAETPAEITDLVQVDYQTPAPQIVSQPTDTGVQVTISAENENPAVPLVDVLASTKIPEIFKVGQESKIKIKWKNNSNQNVTFHAYDTDNNGLLDYVEWTVPHLSTQTFEIIFISKAFLLNTDKDITADIYDQVKTKDNVWATVPNGNYVRFTFEKALTTENDITIFARATDSANVAAVQVFPVYTDADGNQTEGQQLVAVQDGVHKNFDLIIQEDTYRILLKNLAQPTATFDIRTANSIDINFIVDPDGIVPLGGYCEADDWCVDTINCGTAEPYCGGFGASCTSDNDCVAGLPGSNDIYCGNSLTCTNGELGNPCLADNLCAGDLVCVTTVGLCTDGENGSPCSNNASYGQGGCNDGHMQVCNGDNICETSDGGCTLGSGVLGEICCGADGNCSSGISCSPNDDTCGGNGASCTGDGDCSSDYCDTGVCADEPPPSGGLGDACSSDEDCDTTSGYYCGTTNGGAGICGGYGATCATDSDCDPTGDGTSSGVHCGLDGQCGDVGAACSYPGSTTCNEGCNCIGGYNIYCASDGICGDQGASCSGDRDCNNTSCVDNHCTGGGGGCSDDCTGICNGNNNDCGNSCNCGLGTDCADTIGHTDCDTGLYCSDGDYTCTYGYDGQPCYSNSSCASGNSCDSGIGGSYTCHEDCVPGGGSLGDDCCGNSDCSASASNCGNDGTCGGYGATCDPNNGNTDCNGIGCGTDNTCGGSGAVCTGNTDCCGYGNSYYCAGSVNFLCSSSTNTCGGVGASCGDGGGGPDCSSGWCDTSISVCKSSGGEDTGCGGDSDCDNMSCVDGFCGDGGCTDECCSDSDCSGCQTCQSGTCQDDDSACSQAQTCTGGSCIDSCTVNSDCLGIGDYCNPTNGSCTYGSLGSGCADDINCNSLGCGSGTCGGSGADCVDYNSSSDCNTSAGMYCSIMSNTCQAAGTGVVGGYCDGDNDCNISAGIYCGTGNICGSYSADCTLSGDSSCYLAAGYYCSTYDNTCGGYCNVAGNCSSTYCDKSNNVCTDGSSGSNCGANEDCQSRNCNGGTCITIGGCVPGDGSVGECCTDDANCTDGSTCGTNDICGGIGGACSSDSNCDTESGLACETLLSSSCQVNGGGQLSDTCSNNYDCDFPAGYYCGSDEKCGGIDALCFVSGNVATDNASCVSGYCDTWITGTCTNGQDGASCAENSECDDSAGYVCDTISTNTCISALGVSCDSDSDCDGAAGIYCSSQTGGGTCGGLGASCEAGNVCSSTWCDTWVGECKATGNVGTTCGGDDDCNIGAGIHCGAYESDSENQYCGGNDASCAGDANCNNTNGTKCVDNICTNGIEGSYCATNRDCALHADLMCIPSFNICGVFAGDCYQSASRCTSDSDCCDGFCGTDGFCGGLGSTCSDNGGCDTLNGIYCSSQTGNGTCGAIGSSCGGDEYCSSGYCNNSICATRPIPPVIPPATGGGGGGGLLLPGFINLNPTVPPQKTIQPTIPAQPVISNPTTNPTNTTQTPAKKTTASEVITNISEKVWSAFNSVLPKISGKPATAPAPKITVPDETPDVLKHKWNLLPIKVNKK